MKEVTDSDTKLIETLWNDFRSAVIPGATPDGLTIARRLFFAGATAIVRMIGESADKNEAQRCLDLLKKETEAYMSTMVLELRSSG